MTYGASGLSVTFGDSAALHGVDLDIPTGEVTAVVGGDGAGKTTLLTTLVGLSTADAGAMSVPPIDEIGYLPALGGTWTSLTVAQNIAFVGGAYGLSGRELDDRVEPMLEAAGLASVGDRLAGQLSGGMRTKLGFILAMLHRPQLVVLDEPTTGVDPVSRVELWKMVSEAAADGAAVVMSTTYIDEAERAHSILMLSRGQTLLAGNPDEVIERFQGAITSTAAPTRREWAWRSGAGFKEYWPDEPPDGSKIQEPSLEDVIVVAEMKTINVASTAGTS